MNRQLMSRRSVAALAAALIATAAAACGGGDDGDGDTTGGTGAGEAVDALGGDVVIGPQEGDGEPTSGGSITVGLESETNSYMPAIFQGSQAGFNVAYAVFDPLVIRNADGEIAPYLAESVEPNDDFTVWTVTLRDGVTFHDGTPLNAEAMKTIFDDFLLAEGTNTEGTLRREVQSVEVVDELTYRYNMTQPNAAWPDTLAIQPGWPFSPTAAAAAGDAFRRGDLPAVPEAIPDEMVEAYTAAGPLDKVRARVSEVAERGDGVWLTPATYFIPPEQIGEYQQRIVDAFGPSA